MQNIPRRDTVHPNTHRRKLHSQALRQHNNSSLTRAIITQKLRFTGHVRTDGTNHDDGAAARRLLAFILLLDLSRKHLGDKIGPEDVDVEAFPYGRRIALGKGLVRADAGSSYASSASGRYLCSSCADYHLQAIDPTEVLHDVVKGLLQDVVVRDIGPINSVETLVCYSYAMLAVENLLVKLDFNAVIVL
jgi:hypothetical protein